MPKRLRILMAVDDSENSRRLAEHVGELAAGAMERDGLFFLAGCAMFVLTLAFFGLLAFGGAHLLDNLRHTVFGA